jgi:hypothetical protein
VPLPVRIKNKKKRPKEPTKKEKKEKKQKTKKMREKERGGTLLSFYHTCASK